MVQFLEMSLCSSDSSSGRVLDPAPASVSSAISRCRMESRLRDEDERSRM